VPLPIDSSAGKTNGNGSTGHGCRYLAAVLDEAAVNEPNRHAILRETASTKQLGDGEEAAISQSAATSW